MLATPLRCLRRLRLVLLLSSVAGCSWPAVVEETPREVVLPDELSSWRTHSFVADVDRRSGRITLSAPRPAGTTPLAPSLVGCDVIAIAASNFAASAVGGGGAPPGKILVTMDLTLTNRLSAANLVRPTFPIPPDSTAATVYLVPLEVIPTTTTGGVSTTGNDAIVELPNYGSVFASPDFDGAPHNFFNDAACAPGSNDCFRYEGYPAPLAAGASTSARRVGFIVDPTVGTFRARLLVAADLANSTPTPNAVIFGSVSSPSLGFLPGVRVTLSLGPSTTTDAAGFYEFDLRAPPGSYSLSLSNLPPGCIAPPPQSVVVPAPNPSGIAAVAADLAVDCSAAAGYTVSGTLALSNGGPLGGIAVSLDGLNIAPVTTLTNSTGGWAITGLAPGTYPLVVSGAPPGCVGDPLSVTVTSSIAGLAVTATCGQPEGILTGAITFAPGSSRPPLGLAMLSANGARIGLPADGGPFAIAVPVPGGSPTTAYQVGITRLPPGCTATPSSLDGTGLPSGGTIDIGPIVIDCIPTPYYPVRGEWTSLTATSATLQLWIDLTTWNDPTNNGTGPDEIEAFDVDLRYPEARLTVRSCQSAFPSFFQGLHVGQVLAGGLVLSGGLSGARLELLRCDFSLRGGPPVRPVMVDLQAARHFSPMGGYAGVIDLLP